MRVAGNGAISYGFPFGVGCYTEQGGNEMILRPVPGREHESQGIA